LGLVVVEHLQQVRVKVQMAAILFLQLLLLLVVAVVAGTVFVPEGLVVLVVVLAEIHLLLQLAGPELLIKVMLVEPQ
jgi:hypothetical protein